MKTTALALISFCLMTFLPAGLAAEGSGQNGKAAESGEQKLSVRLIDSGVSSGVGNCRKVVIRTPREWAALWRQHASGTTERQLPAVDFSKEMVLAVFAGNKKSSGYSVSINNVARAGKRVHVTVVAKVPGKDDITSQVQTQPFVIVAVPTSMSSVRWMGDPCGKL